MRKYLLYIALFIKLFPVHLSAQVEEDRIKASLIYYLSDFITWPQEEVIDTFIVGVLGDNKLLFSELSIISKEKSLKGKMMYVSHFYNLSDLSGTNILYATREWHPKMGQIIDSCRQQHILVFTDQLDAGLYSMINFYENPDDNSINFKVNKQNLFLAGLDYDERLLLYGGSLLDARELYNTTQILLEKESKKAEELNQELSLKDKELERKNEVINNLSKNIRDKIHTLESLKDSVERQHKILTEQLKTLELQNIEIGKALEEKDRLKEQNMELSTAIAERQEQNNRIVEENDRIEKENLLLSDQKNRLEDQVYMYTELKEAQENMIRSKNKLIALSVVLVASFALIGILLLRSNRLKQKSNLFLEEKVRKRTSELNELNKDLEAEIRTRKQFEAELIQSEQNYREIFNSSVDAIFIQDTRGNFLDVNSAVERIFGYSRSEILQLTVEDLSSGIEGFTIKDAGIFISRCLKEGKISFDWLSKRSDQSLFWTEITLQVNSIAGVDRLMAVVRDIDEKKKNEMELDRYKSHLEEMIEVRTNTIKEVNDNLKRANEHLESQKEELEQTLNQLQKTQNQLIESEKLATVGMLATGVSHEINNPLNFIQGGIYGLESILEREEVNITPEMRILIDSIKTGVDRASDIVTSLNHFNRQPDSKYHECDLKSIIHNCLTMLKNRMERIEIKLAYQETDLFCSGNENSLHQAIINLLSNAIDAIHDTGEISIGGSKGKNKLNIEISDNGTGIKPEYLSKITEPFFTTKNPGQGTGLGLTIANQIIADHKGNLEFKSEYGKGTTVIVRLPIQQTIFQRD